MIKFIEMDEKVILSAQMEENEGPVILINKFNVKPEDVDQLLRAWAADASYFKQQPGFISAQLHRGIGGSCVFVNYAVWESPQHFKMQLISLSLDPSWENIPIVQLHLPIYLRRLQYLEFVLMSSIQTNIKVHRTYPSKSIP